MMFYEDIEEDKYEKVISALESADFEVWSWGNDDRNSEQYTICCTSSFEDRIAEIEDILYNFDDIEVIDIETESNEHDHAGETYEDFDYVITLC